jgi:hypothetical protein
LFDAHKISPTDVKGIMVFATSDKGGFDNEQLKTHILT